VPSYMPQAEHAGATLGSGPAQYMTTQPEHSSYSHAAASRSSYAAGQVDFPMVEQTEADEPAGASGAQEALDEGLRNYHLGLRAVFDAIIGGRVTSASEKLLVVSRWLVNSVTALGKFVPLQPIWV
jgi:hypothetical protein